MKLIPLIIMSLILIPSVLAASIFTNPLFDAALIIIVVAVIFSILKNMLKSKK